MSIQFQNLTRQFGSQRVLEPLTFSIEPGEFLTLLGPSGSGKSTLLRIIAGLDQSSSGQIQMDPSFEAQGQRSFVFQESHLLPWRTALENVRLPLELTASRSNQTRDAAPPTQRHVGAARGAQNSTALDALARVGLADSAALYPRELSGGMKMRVSLARALVTRPKLLLLDEPFAALDEHTRHSLQEDLRALWRDLGMTVIFVTHSLSEAVFLSTRTIVLSSRPARVLSDAKSPLLNLPKSRDVRDFQTRTSREFNDEVGRLNRFMSSEIADGAG